MSDKKINDKKLSTKKTASTGKKSNTKKSPNKATTSKATPKPRVKKEVSESIGEKKVELIRDVSTSTPLKIIEETKVDKVPFDDESRIVIINGKKIIKEPGSPSATTEPEISSIEICLPMVSGGNTKKPNLFIRIITLNIVFNWWK